MITLLFGVIFIVVAIVGFVTTAIAAFVTTALTAATTFLIIIGMIIVSVLCLAGEGVLALGAPVVLPNIARWCGLLLPKSIQDGLYRSKTTENDYHVLKTQRSADIQRFGRGEEMLQRSWIRYGTRRFNDFR
eukprot:GHVO01065201.1.p1 GENE.GHVO01065201.1~~GHVO01065201.1.p1  ORF type:complete len:132 (+),score=21.30 GHVO01065201.1:42-437(+)